MNLTDKTQELEGKFIDLKASTGEIIARFQTDASKRIEKVSADQRKALTAYIDDNFWRKEHETKASV